MSLLKKIPISYKGELHDVRLVNFLVPMEEVHDAVPPSKYKRATEKTSE